MQIRLATRASALALWQAERVSGLIRNHFPDAEISLVRISTRPDRQPELALEKLGGDKGLFVKEVEDAILRDEADAAVHSLKDVPADLPQGLHLVAFPERADARDILLSRNGEDLSQLPQGAKVATSSLRRRGQLLRLRPDLQVADVRGNVDTRVSKLRSGQFDAIVLAAAGLERLGLLGSSAHYLEPEQFVPAAGQGIIAVEAASSSILDHVWRVLDNSDVRLCAEVERSFVRSIGAGCRTPTGCHAIAGKDDSYISAMVCGKDGHPFLHTGRTALRPDAVHVASEIATEMLLMGADKLLDEK
jgi:hydroxymethylbilane synthase